MQLALSASFNELVSGSVCDVEEKRKCYNYVIRRTGGVTVMDKLFDYNTEDMVTRLGSVEEKMRECCYRDNTPDLETVSQYAKAYIRTIFTYMQKYFKPDKCTVFMMIKELQCIAGTKGYVCLKRLEGFIGGEGSVFEYVREEEGLQGISYAACLLRYYYIMNEREPYRHQPWREVDSAYKKVVVCVELEKKARIEKTGHAGTESAGKAEREEGAFMKALHSHMDKYYVGQEVLKKKLCSVIAQWKFHGERTTFMMAGPSGCGKNYMIETIRSFPELGMPVISYDCSSITPVGFSGSDANAIFKKVQQLKYKDRKPAWLNMENGKPEIEPSEKCIVYLDEIDKIINFNHDSRGESVNAMVQQQLLSALAGTEIIEGVDTSKVLFILGGAFPRIKDLEKETGTHPIGFRENPECVLEFRETLREQIVAIGGEVEFVGHIEEIFQMSRLTREDLKQILMDENIGVFVKKKKLYQDAGLTLEMDEDMIDAILDLIENEDAGARSVKNVMNQLADNRYFYDMKVEGYSFMRIHKGMLRGEAPVFLSGKKQCRKTTGCFR